MWSTLLPKRTVLVEGELLEGAETFDGILLLVVALKPYLAIGMGVGKGLDERG